MHYSVEQNRFTNRLNRDGHKGQRIIEYATVSKVTNGCKIRYT